MINTDLDRTIYCENCKRPVDPSRYFEVISWWKLKRNNHKIFYLENHIIHCLILIHEHDECTVRYCKRQFRLTFIKNFENVLPVIMISVESLITLLILPVFICGISTWNYGYSTWKTKKISLKLKQLLVPVRRTSWLT